MSVLFEQLLIFALTVAVVGALAHLGGEALPRGAFDASAFPWTPFKWERSGRVYEALRVGRWKLVLK